MKLDKYFKETNMKMPETASKFWSFISNYCFLHVEKMINFFMVKKPPNVEWAILRYKKLIEPENINFLIIFAQNILENHPKKGQIDPIRVQVKDDWYITISVFPSEKDHDFLAACPGFSFENLARKSRKNFIESEPNWFNLDFAHWILLLNKPKFQFSIHLHTVWSFIHNLEFMKIINKSGKRDISFPLITPIDLLKEDYTTFYEEQMILDSDFFFKIHKQG